MPFTQNIQVASPANADSISGGANVIRNLARDLKERLESLVFDADSDPLVLLPNLVNASAILASSVTTVKIADSAVTNAKLANGSITNAKLSGAFVFPTVTPNFSDVSISLRLRILSGPVIGHRTVSAGGAYEVNAQTTNHHRHTMTSAGMISINDMQSSQGLFLEIGQNSAGGHTVTFNSLIIWPGNDTAPLVTTIGNRKDCFVFIQAGADTLGFVVGQNLPSVS